MASVFISHSSKNDRYAKRVRELVEAGLKHKHYKVLLDATLLDPGDAWRAKLHRWLGECNGAVILLSRAALASEWVRKEAAILTWRRSLGYDLKIVPALLGDVHSNEARSGGFRALELGESEFARLQSTEQTTRNAKKLAKLIVAQFSNFGSDEEDSPMQIWLEDVAQSLEGIPEVHLNRARKLLKIDPTAWAHFPDRLTTLAHQLLYSGLETATPALRELVKTMPTDKREQFLGWITPIWVDPRAAQAVLGVASAKDPEHRVLAIDAQDYETGLTYVERATCCDGSYRKTNATDVAGEKAVDEIFRKYEAAIRTALYLRPEDEIREEDIQGRPAFVILRKGPHRAEILKEVLARLRHAYKGLTFVLLTGASIPDGEQLGVRDLVRIEPFLGSEQERKAGKQVREVRSLIRK
jgi:TIR domain